MLKIGFEIKSQRELRRAIVELTKERKKIQNTAKTISFWFEIVNTDLTSSFYDEIAKFECQELSFSFRFTGDCLNTKSKPKFPSGLRSFSVWCLLPLNKSAVCAICESGKDLEKLEIFGYHQTSMKTIDKLLLACPKITELYVSYLSYIPKYKFVINLNLKTLRIASFEFGNSQESPLSVFNFWSWFPSLDHVWIGEQEIVK